MSAPPKPTVLSKEDYPSEAEWIDRLLAPLNSFMTSTVTALTKGLTIDENLQAQIQELTFTTTNPVTDGFPLYFSVKSGGRPRTVTVGFCEDVASPTTAFTTAVFPTWSFTPDGRVKISYISGLTVSTKYRIRFVCFA